MDPKVLILMGSDSDWEVMSEARKALAELGVASEVHVSSAHRTPDRTAALAREDAGRRPRGLPRHRQGGGAQRRPPRGAHAGALRPGARAARARRARPHGPRR